MTIMKKYISPIAKSIVLDYEGLVAVSGEGGLSDGDGLGNGYNSDDISGSNRRGIWGDTEW